MSPPSRRRASYTKDSNEQQRIRQELEKVFTWNPLPYRGKGSPGTRPPAFFDEHLDDRLILKDLIHLPTLTSDLASTVDRFLRNDRPLPPFPADFNLREQLDDLSERAAQTEVMKERQVAENFRNLHATLAPVASALSLGDFGCFSWDIARELEKHAIPDAYFTIGVPSKGTIAPTKEKVLNEISGCFDTAGILEFKGLKAGRREHLEGIIKLSDKKGPFPWCKCKNPSNCSGHYGASGPITTGAPMAFDSTDSICRPPAPAVRIDDGVAQRKQPSDNVNPKNKKRKATTKTKKDDELHSLHLTQQVWAELVLHDATYALLQCGNFEVFFKRIRRPAALYVSDVVEAAKYQGYGKLHIGFLLAMYVDARNRTRQIKEAKEMPEIWKQYKLPNVTKPQANTEGRSKKGLSEAEKWNREKNLMKHARRSPSALVVIKKGNLFRPGNVGEFKRFPVIDTPGQTDKVDCISIDIHSEIPGSGMVFNAKIRANGTISTSPFIVKWARSRAASALLEKEYQNFQILRPVFEAIPSVIGFFTLDAPRHGAILVMKEYGVSLDKRGKGITLAARMECIRCLDKLHSAGFLHSNLTAGKFLDGPSGVILGGLRNIERSRSSAARRGEHLKLSQILNILQEEYVERLRKSDKALKRPRNDLHPANSALLLGPISLEMLLQLKSQEPLDESCGLEPARKAIHEISSKVEAKLPDLLYVETCATLGPDGWETLMEKYLPNIPYHCIQVSRQK